MKKIVLVVVILSVVLGVFFWKFSGQILEKGKKDTKTITLNFWNLSEDESIMKQVANVFYASHPNIKIIFNKQTLLNYRTRLKTQLDAGGGPDIFEIHSSWLPMFYSDLSQTPDSIMDSNEYSQIFYPIAKDTLTLKNKIYAFPLELDGIAMYYNEDILNAAGVKIPVGWQEFLEDARKMTVKNQVGQIQTSGAALGAVDNIDFWPEIIGSLFLQQTEGNFLNPATKDGAEVLQFYTGFVIDPKNKTWDVNLPSSTNMFAEGKLAFYFAPYKQIQVIQSLNPSLHFKVAPIPQLPNRNFTYSGFWVGVVSSKSMNRKEAWEFLKFLDSPEALKLIAQAHLQAQTSARLSPRIDMSETLVKDPLTGPFVSQALNYKSWYLNSGTSDSGINEEMISIYRNAINGVLQGQDADSSLQGLLVQVKQVLAKYQIAN